MEEKDEARKTTTETGAKTEKENITTISKVRLHKHYIFYYTNVVEIVSFGYIYSSPDAKILSWLDRKKKKSTLLSKTKKLLNWY